MSHWFIQPQEQDILGDQWSRKIAACWTRMKEADPELTGKPHAGQLWQWAMCQLADMPHRCVAGPNAIAIAAAARGEEPPNMDLIEPLLTLSDRVLQEMFAPVGA